MQTRVGVGAHQVFNPLYAILLASPIPLFLGAVLCNWAYASTYEIQWTNFASWLVAGGLVFVGAALVWTVVGLFSDRGRWGWISLGLAVATFVSGLITALFLAKDAWAAMPESLILSIITLILLVAANWVAYSGSASERRA